MEGYSLQFLSADSDITESDEKVKASKAILKKVTELVAKRRFDS